MVGSWFATGNLSCHFSPFTAVAASAGGLLRGRPMIAQKNKRRMECAQKPWKPAYRCILDPDYCWKRQVPFSGFRRLTRSLCGRLTTAGVLAPRLVFGGVFCAFCLIKVN